MADAVDDDGDGVRFISEPIAPDRGTFDASAMAGGEAGLPAGFTWRGDHYSITEVIRVWKESGTEGFSGERYYRRRCFEVRVDSGEVMTLYALRQSMGRGSNKKRWWLYTVG